MEYALLHFYPHRAVRPTLQDGAAERHIEQPPRPKALQRVKYALAGALAKQRRGDIACPAQATSTFQKDEVIDTPPLHHLAPHSR